MRIAKLSAQILTLGLCCLFIFHLLVLFQILPSTIIWGGQITSENFLFMEVIAIIILGLFLFVASVRAEFLGVKIKPKILKIFLWIIAAYFLLNTIGNIASGVTIEKLIFTPISLIFTILAFLSAK